MPNKLFEYMGAGLAVVASDFPIWRPLVADTGCGVLVDPANPDEIAAALDALAADPHGRKVMGDRGMECAGERFSWSTAERVLLDAYRALESRRPPIGLATGGRGSRSSDRDRTGR